MLKRIVAPRARICIYTSTKRFYSAPGDRQIPASKQKYIPTSGTYPKGFRVGSTHVGVKASNTKYDDLALITSDMPCTAAGVFTKNVFQAAPVTVCKQLLAEAKGASASSTDAKQFDSVIINSGCANAVTGKGGIEDAWAMSRAADSALLESSPSPSSPASSASSSTTPSSPSSKTFPMSTGVIGQRLPINKITSAVPTAASKLSSSHESWLSVANAICTTDTFPKLVSREFTLPAPTSDGSISETKYRTAGIVKGAGMIHPNMGTLLSCICTDAPISSENLQNLTKEAVEKSFNRISIDGDTSTNDTLLVLSNGAASASTSTSTSTSDVTNTTPESKEYLQAFSAELTALCTSLAKLVVRDGEGATKFLTLRIRGAPSTEVAATVAKTIAKSPLFKTAMYGQDANWGRILCAVGYAGAEHPDVIKTGDIEPTETSVSFVPATPEQEERGMRELKFLVNGEPCSVDEEVAGRMLKEEDLEVLVRLRPDSHSEGTEGKEDGEEAEAWREREGDLKYWTCDFSHEYVTINGDYRT